MDNETVEEVDQIEKEGIIDERLINAPIERQFMDRLEIAIDQLTSNLQEHNLFIENSLAEIRWSEGDNEEYECHIERIREYLLFNPDQQDQIEFIKMGEAEWCISYKHPDATISFAIEELKFETESAGQNYLDALWNKVQTQNRLNDAEQRMSDFNDNEERYTIIRSAIIPAYALKEDGYIGDDEDEDEYEEDE